jgi:hypothetical protein
MSVLCQRTEVVPLERDVRVTPEADITPTSPYVRFVPTGPLASQRLQISEVICLSAGALREQQTPASSSRKSRT